MAVFAPFMEIAGGTSNNCPELRSTTWSSNGYLIIYWYEKREKNPGVYFVNIFPFRSQALLLQRRIRFPSSNKIYLPDQSTERSWTVQ